MTFEEIFENLLFEFLNYLEIRGCTCRICIIQVQKMFHLTVSTARYSVETENLLNNEYFLNFVQFLVIHHIFQ